MSINNTDLSSLDISQLNSEFEKVVNTRSYHRRASLIQEGYRRGLVHQRGRGFVTVSSAASHFVQTDSTCRRVRELLENRHVHSAI